MTIQRLARARLARARFVAFLQLLAVLRIQRVARGHLARVALRHSHPYAYSSAALSASPSHRRPPRQPFQTPPTAQRTPVKVVGVRGQDFGAPATPAAGAVPRPCESNVGQASRAAHAALPTITYAVGTGRARLYWESGGGGGGALVGSWANALWAPPSLLP